VEDAHELGHHPLGGVKDELRVHVVGVNVSANVPNTSVVADVVQRNENTRQGHSCRLRLRRRSRQHPGVYFQNVDLHGLLLAGIIIGSLGVLDDVTVTQAATVAELAEANPTLPRLRLYQAATRVGRAHIAAVVNTIVLAYAGASLPLLLLILTAGRGVSETLTSEFVAQEIVRSTVATIGLVAAVPVTTALATLITAGHGAKPQPDQPSEPRASDGEAQRRPARHAADRLGPVHRRLAPDDPWQEPADPWPDPTSRR
jgi:hypothetical protein